MPNSEDDFLYKIKQCFLLLGYWSTSTKDTIIFINDSISEDCDISKSTLQKTENMETITNNVDFLKCLISYNNYIFTFNLIHHTRKSTVQL